MTKVKQLANNQFIITEEHGEILQSYESIIAFKPYWAKECYEGSGKTELDQKYWNYSKTTSKYRNQFLDETTKETQAKIDSGEYLLPDLNR